MKKLYKFLLSCLGLLLLSFSGYAQCSNQITTKYYNNGLLVTDNTNKGQSGYTGTVCPTAGAAYTFSASSTSNARMTWSRVITRGSTPDLDVVSNIETRLVPSPNEFEVELSFTTTTTFRLESDAGKGSYPGNNCNNTTISYVYLTLTPALALSSPNFSGVCIGSDVTLNASGSTTGVYTWTANGVTLNKTSSSITEKPLVTTTYTVTTSTNCGTSSQQLTIPVKDVTISPSAPTICSGQSTTLTANYNGDNTGISYNWTVKGGSTSLPTTKSITVTPTATTTYQVVVNTNDCGQFTKEVTVTIGAPTVAISPSAATICSGGSSSLTAVSNNPNATFTWSPSTSLSSPTGATVIASPTTTTTYTVTATTPCGVVTSQVVVTVTSSAEYKVTPSPAVICSGSSITLTASSNITAASYRWYKTTDLGTILSTTASLTVAPTANTTYRVITTTSCNTNTTDVPVTVKASPSVTVSPYNISIRPRSSVTLKADDGTTGTTNTYAWTASTESATSTLSETTQSITVSPRTATTYTVTVTNSVGCSATSQSVINPNIPLPVELISFVATWTSSAPKLTWATASEKNNAYFDIERSVDGSTFQVVGKRLGAGTTLSQTEYQFSDESVYETAASTLYYRLHQVDITGESNYSPVRSVQPKAGKYTFQAEVFPNPYEDKVTVQYRSFGAGTTTLTIHDVLGHTLLTKTVAATAGAQEIELPEAASLSAGVYYLTIRQGGQQQVMKLSHR
ncbi:hypothetical protein SAMN00120144_0492 [Hymenobacter roseosalivarius DSM 11622]|uniref:Ig-like domain-containing protein n=1 Tax=Hymenobacter roseosalivarius DSM 11622 TaxID=645990 RepID=A0A1W1VR80_9BACT|nr:hypothetical protein SAMN00120144_0492 [Hymenobacter roseosalivarius DSM 11622]